MPAPARIAVVGATGRVRRHAVSVLERTGLPVEAISRFTDGAGLPCRAYIRTVARLPPTAPTPGHAVSWSVELSPEAPPGVHEAVVTRWLTAYGGRSLRPSSSQEGRPGPRLGYGLSECAISTPSRFRATFLALAQREYGDAPKNKPERGRFHYIVTDRSPSAAGRDPIAGVAPPSVPGRAAPSSHSGDQEPLVGSSSYGPKGRLNIHFVHRTHGDLFTTPAPRSMSCRLAQAPRSRGSGRAPIDEQLKGLLPPARWTCLATRPHLRPIFPYRQS